MEHPQLPAAAVLISAVGLVGLIAFIVERKRKEIAIRKISGASAEWIAGLIIRDLFFLIGAAGAIGLPLASVLSRKWPEGFYYRIRLEPGIFLQAALFVGAAALLCVARASRENPAVILKSL